MIKDLLKPVLVAVTACVVSMCNEGCRAPHVVDPNDSYAMETAACVAAAKTREESRTCREGVNVRYGLCDSGRTDIPCPKKK